MFKSYAPFSKTLYDYPYILISSDKAWIGGILITISDSSGYISKQFKSESLLGMIL